jgi:hypothetical protein
MIASADGREDHYSGQLGRWLSVQRYSKKGDKGYKELSADREDKLQRLVDLGASPIA